MEDGNENLNCVSFLLQAVGAISGILMAIFVNNTHSIGPFQCFGIYLILQIIFFIAALLMNKELEPGQISDIKSDSESPRSNVPDDNDGQNILIMDQAENELEPEEKSKYQIFKLNL